MRILGVIPARGGSKGVPGKNIKLLGNKPLLAYTASVALACPLLSTVVLSTDDEKIAAVGRDLGLEVPFLRPNDLAEDRTPTLPVILHALAYYESMGEYFDAVCLLQVTSPFRPPGLIEKSIEIFIKAKADALVSVLQVPETYNPHWTFEANPEGFLKIATGENKLISRRQDLPEAFHRDGSIYITATETLKTNSLYGQKLAYVINDSHYYINIDTMEDWEAAELWLKNNYDLLNQ